MSKNIDEILNSIPTTGCICKNCTENVPHGQKAKQAMQIEEILEIYNSTHRLGNDEKYFKEAAQAISQLIDEARENTDKVDRVEVIDETGRAYVKGSIYGSPVKVKLSYQDDDRTLKVFVKELKGNSDDS